MLEALVTVPKEFYIKDTELKNFAEIDEFGRLILPPELVKKFGLVPGDRLYMESGEDTFRLHRPVSRPARIYVEPTTRCNMNCAMCQRHAWTDSPGDMPPGIFKKILEMVDTCDPVPSIVFGGFGEPLMHPLIFSFIRECKKRNASVELITNGLLLNRQRLSELKNSGLDRLWLSVDGVEAYCNGHTRDQNAFNRLIDDLKAVFSLTHYSGNTHFRLGFVFVAMEDNIHDFPNVMHLARLLNADKVIVSNLLPYTRDGLNQILYTRATWQMSGLESRVKLPRMDLHRNVGKILIKSLFDQDMGGILNGEYKEPMDTCPFIKKASLSVGRDGRVSPCPPLLHSHACYFQDIERNNRACSFGSLEEKSLMEIWNDAAYANFRQKVKEFNFSPCVSCASCNWAEANEEDCTGNTFPTCGGCLWAQGLIQCP